MAGFFNTIINTLVRNVDYNIRIIICFAFFFLATMSLIWSIRKKNDAHPIAWGCFIVCLLSMALAVVYVAL